MNKLDAIKKLNKAAQIYENNFCNKNLLIVYNNTINPNIIEIKAVATNFLHLTGVSVNEKNILNDIEDRNSNVKEVFYLKCLNGRLKENDFEIKKDGSTYQKLDVILTTLNMSKNAKMIGDYNEQRVYLQTDKLVGNTNSCLGLCRNGNYYAPNTVLKGDIRDDTHNVSRVLAVLSKQINEHDYNEKKYVAKEIDIQKLLQTISSRAPIDEKLLTPSEPTIAAAPNINKISYSPISYSGGSAVLSPAAPGENIRSFFNKVKNSIVGALEKKAKQPSTNNETELRTLKEQLLQKDEEIAKKDRTIAKKSEEIAKKGNLIDDLIKASEAITEEKNKLSEIAKNQRNKIHQINSWLNANPDIKERLLKDKKEHRSVFASSPTENSDRINTKLSDISDSKVKQTHKPKNKKSL